MTNKTFMCHMDLDEGMSPDSCVLDGGDINDCVYAKRYGLEAKTKCGEWKPIAIVPFSQRQWVGLTDEEFGNIEVSETDFENGFVNLRAISIAIESKLREKNT
jgi:hypothetical protein